MELPVPAPSASVPAECSTPNVGIYLDTSILRAHGWPRRPSERLQRLLELAEVGQVPLLIPIVVRWEMRQQWLERFRKEQEAARVAFDKFTRAVERLKRYDSQNNYPPPLFSDETAEMERYEEDADGDFRTGRFELVPLPSVSLADLLKQSAEHRRPFPAAEDEGFRDGVIVLSIAEHGRKQEGRVNVVVTSDERLSSRELWEGTLADVVTVDLDERGLDAITQALQAETALAFRRTAIAEIGKHIKRRRQAIAAALESRRASLQTFVRQLRVPDSIVKWPRRLHQVDDIEFVGIGAVYGGADPWAPLAPGTHETTFEVDLRIHLFVELAVLDLPRTFEIGQPATATFSLLSPRPKPPMDEMIVPSKATVTAQLVVGDGEQIEDVSFLSLEYGDVEHQLITDLARHSMEQDGYVFRDPGD